jgi:aromatic ring-opening dioxygenase catalytic subunit (LigB family)
MTEARSSLPTFFIPHGGGPCFFMENDPPDVWDPLANFLKGLAASVGAMPKALIVISGHWEENVIAVNAGAHPPMLFDYYGFPPETYRLTYPAPGAPDLALRVETLLNRAGLPVREETRRGYDHGVFVPFKLIYPQADVPIVQISIHKSFDPALHLAVGEALSPLRQEGVLIIGSGMSYHNLRRFRTQYNPDSEAFDAWLSAAVEAPPGQREAMLISWESAPAARQCQPREDHLVPLFVAAGAAIGDKGTRVFHDAPWNAAISGYRFG